MVCTVKTAAISLAVNSREFIDFNIYPNPTSDYINIIPGDVLSNDLNISLINSSGQILRKFTNVNSKGLLINLSDYPHGIYFVEFETAGTKKVIKKVIHF